jgi:anti-sigma B factor antagonist
MELTKEGILTSSEADGVVVLRFDRGRIRDERELLKALHDLCLFAEPKTDLRMVLDMSNIEYLSSAGLGALVGLLKKIRTNKGALKLCCMHSQIYELFEVMRLEKIFEICGTQDEALQSLRA